MITYILIIQLFFIPCFHCLIYEGNIFQTEWNFLSRFCFHPDDSLLKYEIAYPESLGSLDLYAQWNAPEMWDLGYTSQLACWKKTSILKTFSPTQTLSLSTNENAWCRHIDMRDFAHPIKLPDFHEAESGMLPRPLEAFFSSTDNQTVSYGVPRQPYARLLETYKSSVLERAFALYQTNRGSNAVPPNWIYCKSPEIRFKPMEISWWFFALSNCKTPETYVNGDSESGGNLGVESQVQTPNRLFYRMEMRNGEMDRSLFRRNFSADEFGILELTLVFWLLSIGAFFICGWVLLTLKRNHHLLPTLYLAVVTLFFAFLKWLFALMCLGHLSNTGSKPVWIEILGEVMGGVSNSALVATLLVLASGWLVVHQQVVRRLRMTLYGFVGCHLLIQIVCGFTKILMFDAGRAKYIYQSPTGYFLATLSVVTWIVFLLVCIYTNSHWPTKRMFYIQLLAVYSLWFWTLPLLLIINGDYIPLWRRLILHRSIESIMDLFAQVFLLYLFWPTLGGRHFLSATGDNEELLATVPRTTVEPEPGYTVTSTNNQYHSSPPKPHVTPKRDNLGGAVARLGGKPGDLAPPSSTEAVSLGLAPLAPLRPRTPVETTPRNGGGVRSDFLKKMVQ